MEPYDAIVIGGGHNGLTAAAYLARAGRRVAVLERREILGGAAVTEEVWPGWKVSTASYVCSLLDPRIVADLRLVEYGYHAYRKDPASFTPLLDGRSLLLGRNDAENARAIAAFDPGDVAGAAAFSREATRLGTLLADAFELDDPSDAAIGEADLALLRAPVAQLAERFVRTPVLQAELANDGLIGTYAGPRDPGTTYVLAHHNAGRALGIQGAWGFVRGGMGAISNALAAVARDAGAETYTEAAVARILVRDGRAYGVELRDGREFHARAILSNADPFVTFGKLLEPRELPPSIAAKLATWQCTGAALKLNLALGEAPNFTARPGAHVQAHHSATVHVAPDIDYQQAAHDDARREGVSRAPYLECFMQTPTDPDLAPPGKHLLSIFAQYFPYDRPGGWDARKREDAADAIVATLAQHAPNLPNAIEARQILAPPDIEARFGLSGGHIFHGELVPGQMLAERFPARTGIDGLYLCGSGASPGGCVSGMPGRNAARELLRTYASV